MVSLVKFEPPLLYQLILFCCLSISGGQSGHIVLLWYCRFPWKLLFDVGLSKSVNECVHFLRCVLFICFVCICSLIWDRYLSFCHRNNHIPSTDTVSLTYILLCVHTSCSGLFRSQNYWIFSLKPLTTFDSMRTSHCNALIAYFNIVVDFFNF